MVRTGEAGESVEIGLALVDSLQDGVELVRGGGVGREGGGHHGTFLPGLLLASDQGQIRRDVAEVAGVLGVLAGLADDAHQRANRRGVGLDRIGYLDALAIDLAAQRRHFIQLGPGFGKGLVQILQVPLPGHAGGGNEVFQPGIGVGADRGQLVGELGAVGLEVAGCRAPLDLQGVNEAAGGHRGVQGGHRRAGAPEVAVGIADKDGGRENQGKKGDDRKQQDATAHAMQHIASVWYILSPSYRPGL